MRFRRRRTTATPAPVIADAQPAPLVPAPRIERLLYAVVVHARQIEDRIDRLEQRLDDIGADALDWATHDDLLDARLHSAKLAGEMARLNIELRGEIERAFNQARAQAPAVAAPPRTPRQARLEALAETIIDLDDRLYEAPVIQIGRERAAG